MRAPDVMDLHHLKGSRRQVKQHIPHLSHTHLTIFSRDHLSSAVLADFDFTIQCHQL